MNRTNMRSCGPADNSNSLIFSYFHNDNCSCTAILPRDTVFLEHDESSNHFSLRKLPVFQAKLRASSQSFSDHTQDASLLVGPKFHL